MNNLIHAPTEQYASGAIDYHGKGAFVTVTAEARAILEEFGYSFPVKNGRLCWDLPGCVEFDVSENDAHTSLVLTIKDINTAEGKRVFVCRSHATKAGKHVHSDFIFRPDWASGPFCPILPGDELNRYCTAIEG